MNTSADAITNRLDTTIRSDVRAMTRYPVSDASGYIKLDAMENPYVLPEHLQKELGERLAHVLINRYPVPDYKALKALVCKKLGVPEGFDVMLGNGSDEVIAIMIQAIAGGTVLCLAPSFVMFEIGAKLNRTPFIGVPLNPDFTLNMVAMREAIAQHQPKLIFVVNPNNPTGNLFADADIDAALPVLVNAIIQNAGQTCSAGSRVLIEEKIYDTVMAGLAAKFSDLVAAPSQQDRDLGPLISKRQQQRVWDYLSDAHTAGLEFAAQGSIVDDAPESGFYQAPVLLSNVPSSSKLFQEEIFGPVLVATSFRDDSHALELANATQFGLVAGIWSRDGGRQMRMAKAVRSGQVFINNYGAGGGVELPFGGVGASGYGREKGFEALYSFTALKTIAIKHD